MNAPALLENVSLITPDRLENLVRAQGRVTGVPGDIAELGVYRGGSAKVLAEMWPDRMLHLFDTFEGLPCDEVSDMDPEGYVRKGMFGANEQEVRNFLGFCNVAFHVGLFPETTVGLNDLHFCFVHVDCDLHEAAKDAIKWFWPRMNRGGIMFFDDYGCKFTGVTKAVDNVFAPERIEKQYDVHGNQIGALVVKRG